MGILQSFTKSWSGLESPKGLTQKKCVQCSHWFVNECTKTARSIIGQILTGMWWKMTKKLIVPGESHNEFTHQVWFQSVVCLKTCRNWLSNQRTGKVENSAELHQKSMRSRESHDEFVQQISAQSNLQFVNAHKLLDQSDARVHPPNLSSIQSVVTNQRPGNGRNFYMFTGV